MGFKDFLNEHRDEIASSTGTHVTVMLYDEAIRQLNLAIKAVKARDITARCNAVTMVCEIVEAIHNTLDRENGKDIAEQLGMVYRFILRQLPRVNFYNDSETAAQMIGLLEPLRDSWHAIDQKRAAERSFPAEAPMAAVA